MGLGTTLVLLAIGLLAGALGMVAGNGIWAMDRPALNLTADVTCLLLTFGLGWMWIPTQFAEGAARAVMTGALAAAGVRWIIFSLLMRRPPLVPVPSPNCGRPHV
jgi:O-antigen/teichoic acid export membrane protein